MLSPGFFLALNIRFANSASSLRFAFSFRIRSAASARRFAVHAFPCPAEIFCCHSFFSAGVMFLNLRFADSLNLSRCVLVNCLFRIWFAGCFVFSFGNISHNPLPGELFQVLPGKVLTGKLVQVLPGKVLTGELSTRCRWYLQGADW